MNIFRLFIFIACFAVMYSCSTYRYSPSLTVSDLNRHVSYLSSDDLEGRLPGTDGDIKAGIYIDNCFRNAGLIPRHQEFSFIRAVGRGKDNRFLLNGLQLADNDFTPLAFSHDSCIESLAVFAGYGLDVKTDSVQWDDYDKLDVKGKWVIVLRGYPKIGGLENYLSLGSDDRDKTMLAFDKGAAGIILVSGKYTDPDDKLPVIEGLQARTPIPAFQIHRNIADLILQSSGRSVSVIENSILKQRSTETIMLKDTISAMSKIENIKGYTTNHYALLRGSGPAANEYIVIGAHMDHLGKGGPGSSSRAPDANLVHNGADDNASGISVMLELASLLGSRPSGLNRSFIFAAFGAEEKGLLGSKYFVNHLPVDSGSIVAMINLDMVGRLDTLKGLQIGGAGTSVEADSLIKSANNGNLKLVINREGSGPSDHSSFYGKNIPVFFITSGAHADYHTPEDDASRINMEGMMDISQFTFRLANEINIMEKPLAFREAGPKETAAPGYRFRVTLGFMPDFSATDVEGVKVDFVSKGKAAERVGIQNGDIITAIDGQPVKNIYDYMYRLSKLSKGQIISAEILRAGKKEIFVIQL